MASAPPRVPPLKKAWDSARHARVQEQAAQAAASLPPLLVAAEKVAATLAEGMHGRRRVGPGEAFWQYRRYEPGDPASLIDWRASARAPYCYVRENEWAAAQTVFLWCDRSPSMQWASKPKLSLKAERAALLALALSSLLLRAGERVSLLDPALPEARGRGALRRLAEALAPPPATAPAAPSFPPLRPLPRHAALVAISDFLAPMADIEASFKPYAGRVSAGVLVQLLDPAELSLPYQGRIEFSGLEGEGSVLLPKTEALRQAYRKQLAARRDAL